MIYCLSVHHTGTWTAISWLTQHDGVDGFLQEDHVSEVLADGEVYHQVGDMMLKAEFDPKMVYHEHVRIEASKPTRSGYLPDLWWERSLAPVQMVLIGTHPTLIPMRDPLASLVTYQRWAERDGRIDGGNFSPRNQIDDWCALAVSWKILKRFGHCQFLCWDLLNGSREENTEHLLGIANNLGLGCLDPSIDFSDGRRLNSAGEYPLKMALERGDVAGLREGISEGGFDLLRSRERVLRPFLEQFGYEDLLWWSG